MARANNESGSLRFGRRESERLIMALVISLLVHLGSWGGYYIGHKLGLWQKLRMPAWLQSVAKKVTPQPLIIPPSEPNPTIYVDVSHADTDPVKETQYYSDKNSRASNPDPGNSNVPKIDGKQMVMAKTEDVAKPSPKTTASTESQAEKKEDTQQPAKLQPAPQVQSPQPSETPQVPQTPGDLDPRPKITAQPQQQPQEQQLQPQQPRPRTIKEALAQHQLAGRQMHQDGGVQRHTLWSSLDVKNTPFGEYDGAIIEAVQQRWYDLLDNHQYADDRTGKVTIRFRLLSDGTVIEVSTMENTVGDVLGYLCHNAVEQAAPFAKWPPDMVRMVGKNYRDITFTFYYY